jgi:hypothetical protein
VKPRFMRTLGMLSATALVVLLPACTSRGTPAAQGGSPFPSGDATSAAPPSEDPSALPSTDGGSPAPGSPVARACAAADLRLTQLPGGDAAGGTVVVAITLTNKSGHACSMDGYPAFALAAGGTAQPVSIQHGGQGIPTLNAPPAAVTLTPAGQAGFLLVFLNRPQSASGSCTTATTMRLTVRGATVTGPVQISLCGSALKVSPYVSRAKLAPV